MPWLQNPKDLHLNPPTGLAQGSLCVLIYYKYFHHHASETGLEQ